MVCLAGYSFVLPCMYVPFGVLMLATSASVVTAEIGDDSIITRGQRLYPGATTARRRKDTDIEYIIKRESNFSDIIPISRVYTDFGSISKMFFELQGKKIRNTKTPSSWSSKSSQLCLDIPTYT